MINAREKQYKTQIKRWSLDTKYTKGPEYLAMIKTKRRRERGNPPKDTEFTLRGRPIDPKDIARFEKRAIKKGIITPNDDLSDQGKYIPSLGCHIFIYGWGYQTSSRFTDWTDTRIH
jgi:hypothetical protein